MPMTLPPSPSGPSDNTTLTEVVQGYRAAGFVTDFWAEESGVRCASCQSVLDPSRMTMHSLRRLEGASDPADMVAVIATSCPVCGADGTMVVGYGSAATDIDADVLVAMSDRRDSDTLPASSAPDEVPRDR